MITVHRLLVIAFTMRWLLYQLDDQNAFIHGDLDEEVYISFLLGVPCKGKHFVFKSNKSLYRLKQVSRQ